MPRYQFPPTANPDTLAAGRLVLFGVFDWTRENRYPIDSAESTYKRKNDAQRRADKLNREQGGNFVVRTLTL